MTTINLAEIKRDTTAQINIETETDLHKLLQHLEVLGYMWGGGDKPTSFVPYTASFKQMTIWLQENTIYFDTGLSPEAASLKTFFVRGRKKRYPKITPPNVPTDKYITIETLRALNDTPQIPLTLHGLLKKTVRHDLPYAIKLAKFVPGRTAYIIDSSKNVISLGFVEAYDTGVLYYKCPVSDDVVIISNQGVVKASHKYGITAGNIAYSMPKIAAIYMARRVKAGNYPKCLITEFDDYFKSKELVRVDDMLFNSVAGVEERTKKRIREGMYFALPPSFPTSYGTGVHLSTLDDKLLAYYPSTRHILDDIPQRIKPGRYLKKYFPNMSDDDIRVQSAKIIAGSGLKTFSSSEDMKRIYMELKNAGTVESCMSKDRWNKHPLDAYHESDVELAVMYEFGEPKARALYNKHNKHFPMIYGHWEKMKNLLEQSGFKHDTLCGAKINKIIVGNGKVLMPYIDGKRPLNRSENRSTRVNVYGDHCVIDEDGVHAANRYDEGYIYVDGARDSDMHECEHCGDDYEDGEGYHVEHDDISVCEYCWDNHATEVFRASIHTVRAMHSDDFIEIDGEYYMDEEAAEYHGWRSVDDEWHHVDDLILVEDTDEYVLTSEIDSSVFGILDTYYSLDWIEEHVYTDGIRISTNSTTGPALGEAKRHFEDRPDCIPEALWDALPDLELEETPSSEAA